jgi:hypothetical protein
VVRPLLKKPGLDQNVRTNYRPVSNLPFVSKILEKVVANRLEEHLESVGKGSSSQDFKGDFCIILRISAIDVGRKCVNCKPSNLTSALKKWYYQHITMMKS